MHISRLRIRNFRNVRKAEFRLQEGVNALIGENGSGKTNAFNALRLLLDESLPRSAHRLRESDFNRANGDWKAHWIVISVDFADLDSSEGCQILRHGVGHIDANNAGTCTLIFRPKVEIRRALFDLCAEGANREDIERQLEEIDIEQYEPVFTGRATANFVDDDTYKRLVGDFENMGFPDPSQESQDEVGVRLIQPIHDEVSCTFVKALRDVVGDLRSYRDSPCGPRTKSR